MSDEEEKGLGLQGHTRRLQGAGALQAMLTVLSEGETHDGETTTGTSRYLIFFATLQRTLGLTVTITARPGVETRIQARVTELTKNPEDVMRQMYGGQ